MRTGAFWAKSERSGERQKKFARRVSKANQLTEFNSRDLKEGKNVVWGGVVSCRPIS
jgi:hypothetical protein